MKKLSAIFFFLGISFLALPIGVYASTDIVEPYTCKSNDPPVVFIQVDQPPANPTPGQIFSSTFVVANCTGNTWTKNGTFKLGSQSPQDNTSWGKTRIDFPIDVPTNNKINFIATLTAPVTAGSYVFQWGLVKESGAWYKSFSPPLLTSVGAVSTCPAVPNSSTDTRAALQTCIDKTPENGILELNAGTYPLEDQLIITKPLTIRSQGTAGNRTTCTTPGAPSCVRFLALPIFPKTHEDRSTGPFGGTDGLIRGNSPNITLDHIILDGNRANRHFTGDRFDLNARIPNNQVKIFYIASINAFAGTGLGLNGANSNNAVVAYNLFENNGQNGVNGSCNNAGGQKTCSDGLTYVAQGENAVIVYNTFRNNTDVDLIVSGVKNGNIQFNTIENSDPQRVAYAGLMLNSFNVGTDYDSAQSDFSYNTINCHNGLCGFGIEIGGNPWLNQGAAVMGGYFHHNTVTGARQAMNVSGAGTSQFPVILQKNTLSIPQSFKIPCNNNVFWQTTILNINPGDVVTHDQPPNSTNTWKNTNCTVFELMRASALPTPSPSPTPATIPGDLTDMGDVPGDQVNIFDYNLVLSSFGNPYTIFDYNDVIQNFAK
jgi:hypothetical protein